MLPLLSTQRIASSVISGEFHTAGMCSFQIISDRHAYAAAVFSTIVSTRFIIRSSVSSDKDRTVAFMRTLSTTRFAGLPPSIILIERIAASTGFTFLLTTVCKDWIIAAAQTIGSMFRWGIDPCPPAPYTMMSKFLFADITAPSMHATFPISIDGQLCIPKQTFGWM